MSIKIGFYRHYANDKIYKVTEIRTHKDPIKIQDGKTIICYEDYETKEKYTRFEDYFKGVVMINGRTAINRFKYLGKKEKNIPVDVGDIPPKPKGKML